MLNFVQEKLMEVTMLGHTGFKTVEETHDFLFGGKARFTLTSAKTGKHFTYKIEKGKDDGAPFFVNVLRGSNNAFWGGDWLYTGFIKEDNRSELISGHKGTGGSDSFEALKWTLAHLKAGTGEIPKDLTIMHDGVCGVCGKELTHPVSVACGIGPICRSKAA
jgi:hypothetical protein